MRSVTSRNTPLDHPDFESVQRIWDEPTISPSAITQPNAAAQPAPTTDADGAVDLDGRIHLHGAGGDIDLVGQKGLLRIEVSRGADGAAADRFLQRVTDSSSPLWPLARALSIAVDVSVDGAPVAFYDASSPDLDAPSVRGVGTRPGTDRRLDTDEPYGDWTYVDPEHLPPEARGQGDLEWSS